MTGILMLQVFLQIPVQQNTLSSISKGWSGRTGTDLQREYLDIVNTALQQRSLLRNEVRASSAALPETGLMVGDQPGWHADSPPRYPEFLEFRFAEARPVSMIELVPQDGHPERMPGLISISTSFDGVQWQSISQDVVTCVVGDEPRSVEVPLSEVETSRYWRIEILSNCGSPDFLTLKKITFLS